MSCNNNEESNSSLNMWLNNALKSKTLFKKKQQETWQLTWNAFIAQQTALEMSLNQNSTSVSTSAKKREICCEFYY